MSSIDSLRGCSADQLDGFDSHDIKMFLNSRVLGGWKEVDPVWVKLHVEGKNQVLALPFVGQRSISINEN